MTNELRFDDRVVVVTGAGRGVGRRHALHLAARGARVVVADYGVGIDGGGSSPAPAEDVVREIKESGGEAVPCFASVAEERSAAAIIDTAIDAFGRLDAVINNAGIHDPGAFDALTAQQFRAMLDVHFFGTVFVTRAAWPHFIKAGYGRVVNTVSEAMLRYPGVDELWRRQGRGVRADTKSSDGRPGAWHSGQRDCTTGLYAHVCFAFGGAGGLPVDAQGING
jgi:NAD(P)-dependent dehydrogenase (short-subunit alcohol dehydrogenase family)